ncbi:MAG: LPS export ABC transporter periplasmic protein LptC, partial [Nitrospirota bacterium]|nr:LPS export ABC transporter periplasmic protein LptC [Nitrospirota bacterium]
IDGGWVMTSRPSRRYSQIVDLLRFLLPSTALLLIILVIAWPQVIGRYGSLILPTFARGLVDRADVMRMHQPRYVGRTGDAEPYEVTAVSAYLDPTQPNQIYLDQLAADLATAGDLQMHLTAVTATYDRAREKLDLAGGIEVVTSDGYQFQTESAHINLHLGRVIGQGPVAGQGPAGQLSAERFAISDGGQLLRFDGRVKMLLQPPRGKGRNS